MFQQAICAWSLMAVQSVESAQHAAAQTELLQCRLLSVSRACTYCWDVSAHLQAHNKHILTAVAADLSNIEGFHGPFHLELSLFARCMSESKSDLDASSMPISMWAS